MLGWGIELGGGVVVGGTLGEKFASLKTTEPQYVHLRQQHIILQAVAAQLIFCT
jgi:hypothetical protein